MRFEGRISSWHDDRGFGFIAPAQGGAEVFFHVCALRERAVRPTLQQRVLFDVERNRGGKLRASKVELVRSARFTGARVRTPAAGRRAAPLVAIPAFMLLYLLGTLSWRVPHWVAGAYLVLSVVGFILYALDKSAATAQRWRTKERTLLLVGLLGGWPGGLLAQQLLRHKSSKPAFRLAFWGTVLLNGAAFVALSSQQLWLV